VWSLIRCLIKHVLTVWPLTSTSACLVTKQCLMMFGRQTFLVWTGLNRNTVLNQSAQVFALGYFLNTDKTWVFGQSEREQGAIYIINRYRTQLMSKVNI